jgi:hypothetical protein
MIQNQGFKDNKRTRSTEKRENAESPDIVSFKNDILFLIDLSFVYEIKDTYFYDRDTLL